MSGSQGARGAGGRRRVVVAVPDGGVGRGRSSRPVLNERFEEAVGAAFANAERRAYWGETRGLLLDERGLAARRLVEAWAARSSRALEPADALAGALLVLGCVDGGVWPCMPRRLQQQGGGRSAKRRRREGGGGGEDADEGNRDHGGVEEAAHGDDGDDDGERRDGDRARGRPPQRGRRSARTAAAGRAQAPVIVVPFETEEEGAF